MEGGETKEGIKVYVYKLNKNNIASLPQFTRFAFIDKETYYLFIVCVFGNACTQHSTGVKTRGPTCGSQFFLLPCGHSDQAWVTRDLVASAFTCWAVSPASPIAPVKLAMAHTCSPSTEQADEGRFQVSSQSGLHRPCLKKGNIFASVTEYT